MVKTEFEELWSLFKYTDRFNHSRIRLWYLDRYGLRELNYIDILEEDEGMIIISKPEQEGLSYIPYYRIYVIDYDGKILLDRRHGYQGEKDMAIPLDENENS